MANAFKTSVWPMLLILAEANFLYNTSGAYNDFPKMGGPFGEGRPEAAPIICSASIKSIGLR